MKTFCGLKCSVTHHKSLNTSKGIVCCPALIRQSNEHILEFMEEQGVTDARKINVHRDGVLKPTNTFVFTFNTPELPSVVKIGFIPAKVDVYVPNPLRCYQCQVFRHHENKCGRQALCIKCGMPEHCASGQCQRPAKCVNCSGDLPANSKECPQWEKEKKILKTKCEQNISFPEARKQCEQFYQARINVTGSGILGLKEVLVEIWVFIFFESLICLKYTGKILDLLSKKSQSYECFNDVAVYGIFGRIYYTCSHKYFNAPELTVHLSNKLLSLEIILL